MEKIINPMTGEIVDESIDALISLIKEADEVICLLTQEKAKAKQKLLNKASFESGSNTARVYGDNFKCKIEMPSKVLWDQKSLENLYNKPSFARISHDVIKIDSYRVNMREYKKIINSSGDPIFNEFRDCLKSSNLGTTGSPRVTIE